MIFFITFIEFLLGSLFHFLYDFFPFAFVGIIAPINESIFEHLKLVLYPMLLIGFLYLYLIGKMNKKNESALFVSIVVGIMSVVFIYYFYRYGLGIESTIVDILLLFVSQLLGNIAGKIFHKHSWTLTYPLLWMAFLVILFTLFTFFPPCYPIFME